MVIDLGGLHGSRARPMGPCAPNGTDAHSARTATQSLEHVPAHVGGQAGALKMSASTLLVLALDVFVGSDWSQ